jgi:rfaE bifunctional protein kinase chain/domain
VTNLKKAIKKIKNNKILVIGDLMLDLYTYGNVSRISPEAPVPVLLKTGDKYIPGGAANVANNLASLGAKVTICGMLGKDHNGAMLKSLLSEMGVDTSLIIELDDYPTSLKQRIVAGNHQMIRIDEEEIRNLGKAVCDKILKKIKNMAEGFDAIILSDYGKGIFSRYLTQGLIKIAKKHKKLIIADIRPRNKLFFKGVDLVTPNLAEAIEMSNTQNPQKIGKILTNYFKANILLTKSEKGITIFEKAGKATDIPAKKVQVFDVSGAGDTVTAVITLAIISGLSLIDAAALANFAGGVVVQKSGTASITQEELEAFLNDKGHVDSVEIVSKIWGYEKWLENNDRYCSKILWLKKGYQCSLHYHKIKDEMFLVTQGHVKLELGNKIIHMMPGSFIRIPPGIKHRFGGVEESEILEISTHHSEKDSYRIEESRKTD